MLSTSTAQEPASPTEALRSMVVACDSLNMAFHASARRAIAALLADASLLEGMQPEDPNRISRSLLWTDPMNRFGIWVLWWPPGSQTPIHDHHCSCAFGVHRGRIEETFYRADTAADGRAAESERCLRPQGYVGGGPMESKVIHRMRNPDDRLAASVHLYAYHPQQYSSSIRQSFSESLRVSM